MTTPSMKLLSAAGGIAPAFNPSMVSGLVLWLDASDTATITHSSGDVSQWDDKSTSGLDVVQAGANKPRTGDATQNGRNVLSFASGDALAVTPGTKICGSAYSIFVVFRKTGASNAFEAFPVTLTAGNTARPFDAWDGNRFTPNNLTSYTNIKTATSWQQLTLRATSNTIGSFTERKDGAQVGSAANTDPFNTASQAITVASRSDGVTRLTGDIAEILIYNVVVTGTDLTDIENYLASKWGTP